MGIRDILRPILSFRKFVWADRILRLVCNPTLWKDDSTLGRDTTKRIRAISFSRYEVSDILKEYPDSDPLRIVEAIRLLEKNGHITGVGDKSNFLKCSVFCTHEGEIAKSDGFYVRKIIVFWMAIFGIPTSIYWIIKLVVGLL